MNHESQPPHPGQPLPLDQSPPPRREIPPSPAKGHRHSVTHIRQAETTFIRAHKALFGTASGKNDYNLKVSKKPEDWTYRARQFSRQNQGPPTPLQILGRDKDPSERNITTLTDVEVHACIGFHFAHDYPTEIWEEAVLKASPQMIVLGAEPIIPIAPADAAWELTAIIKPALHPDKQYFGLQVRRYCLALGNHAVITDFHDHTEALVESIRQTAIKRLKGTADAPELDDSMVDRVIKTIGSIT